MTHSIYLSLILKISSDNTLQGQLQDDDQGECVGPGHRGLDGGLRGVHSAGGQDQVQLYSALSSSK